MKAKSRHLQTFATLALLAFADPAYASDCPPKAPTVAGSRVTVVYDPADSSMKACVAGTWLTMSGGGGGGGNLDGLTDVVIMTPTANQALVYNGAAWVNAALSLTESDPKVGALTGSKWCAANAGGTAIVCNQNAPAAGASSSGTAGYVQISDGAGGFTTSGTTAGQQLFWDNTSKRLGVGTGTPGAFTALDVNGLSRSLSAELDDNWGRVNWNLYWDNGSSGWKYRTAGYAANLQMDGTDGKLQFVTQGTGAAGAVPAGQTYAMTILQNGNVGIGTASPTYALHSLGGFRISGSSGGHFWSERPDSEFDILLPSGSTKRGLSIHASPTGSSNNVLELYGHNGTAFQIAMAVTNPGNVGIGTLNPSERLEVSGKIKASQFCNTAGVCVDPTSLVPTGAVMAFDLTTCPSGWSEYTAARGRFLRGIDNGAGNDPGGTRAPGNSQADALQQMTGSFKVAGASGGIDTTSGVFTVTGGGTTYPTAPNGPLGSVGYGTFDASLVARTATETRPKNVAVLFCRKD